MNQYLTQMTRLKNKNAQIADMGARQKNPEMTARIVTMREQQGLTFTEIARLEGVKHSSTVSDRYYRHQLREVRRQVAEQESHGQHND